MNKKFIIQLKAAFLLVIFSINTISGFACAMGWDMSFVSARNAKINKDKAPVVQEKTSCHAEPHQSPKEAKSTADNESPDCCGDKMIQFDKLDKSVVKSSTIINPVFLNVFVSTFFNVDALVGSWAPTHIRYFDRSHHLPVPDIRVIIRSFQV